MVQETRPSDSDTPSTLSDDEVADFLAENPDFLSSRPDLFARMRPPTPDRPDGVVDLQSYMVERLRDETGRLKDEHRALISAARANQSSQNRVHAAILFLLDAENFEQLIQAITTDLPVLLDLDVACLLVESNGQNMPHARQGVQVVGEGFTDSYLGADDVILTGNVVGDEALFGAGAGLVRSQALVRLNVSTGSPPCLLALGSREPDAFHAGMRTDLVNFLARVLERCIRSWLDLPA